MPEHLIIGGAQRSATTYLAELLAAHPEIEMAKPARPEPKFFIFPELYTQGIGAYWRTFFQPRPRSGVRVRCEKSTSYIEHADAAERISQMLPKSKIIFMLREPIGRAISNVLFSQSNGYELAALEAALSRELDYPEQVLAAGAAGLSVSPQSYLARGRYIENLRPYFRFFGRDRIHIALTENTVGVLGAIQAIYRFAGVDPDFVPDALHERVNSSHTQAQSVDPELRRRLETYFGPFNEALASECELDLSPWFSCNPKP